MFMTSSNILKIEYVIQQNQKKLKPFNMPMCLLSHFSPVLVFGIPWTVDHQAPLSMKSSRQEHWSGLPCTPPGDLSRD